MNLMEAFEAIFGEPCLIGDDIAVFNLEQNNENKLDEEPVPTLAEPADVRVLPEEDQ